MRKTESEKLNEARRFLPSSANRSELQNFTLRQIRARFRLARLKAFYEMNSCRMARLHLLAAAAIALGRLAGHSEIFDEIGETLMPVDDQNQPRTKEWHNFTEACEKNLPIEIREELWLAAHFKDFEAIRRKGLEEKFYKEAETHKNDSTWQLLQQHLEASLGVRLMDKSAIAGVLPYETAIAGSLAGFVRKISTASFQLLSLYAKETARAAFDFSETPEDLLSYRQTAFALIRYSFASLTASKIFRRGVRMRERGEVAETEGWNLLESVLGDRIAQVAPMIAEFYSNPSRFDVTTTLKLETLPAKFWTWTLTLLFGQGLYESNLLNIPTRFRIFRRADGSMHFIRELYCDGKYRVFDSDFVVKDATLYEVFTDMKIAVEMNVQPFGDKGLLIESRRILWHGRRLPAVGFQVEFQSRVKDETLHIDGHLLMKPKTKTGTFIAHKILRRPKNLGSIHYVARRKDV